MLNFCGLFDNRTNYNYSSSARDIPVTTLPTATSKFTPLISHINSSRRPISFSLFVRRPSKICSTAVGHICDIRRTKQVQLIWRWEQLILRCVQLIQIQDKLIQRWLRLIRKHVRLIRNPPSTFFIDKKTSVTLNALSNNDLRVTVTLDFKRMFSKSFAFSLGCLLKMLYLCTLK